MYCWAAEASDKLIDIKTSKDNKLAIAVDEIIKTIMNIVCSWKQFTILLAVSVYQLRDLRIRRNILTVGLEKRRREVEFWDRKYVFGFLYFLRLKLKQRKDFRKKILILSYDVTKTDVIYYINKRRCLRMYVHKTLWNTIKHYGCSKWHQGNWNEYNTHVTS